MNTAQFTIVATTKGVKRIHLVFACAWCPTSTHIPLKKNEEYTHGICRYHKQQLLRRVKGRHTTHMI